MIAIQMSRVAQVFVAPLVLLIAACAPLGLDYQRPNVTLPSAYNQSDAVVASTAISASWWTLFQDATLNDLIQQALQNNTDIKQAVARIEEAEAAAREIGAETLPSLNLDARGARTLKIHVIISIRKLARHLNWTFGGNCVEQKSRHVLKL
jgi:multidrug efflux system outer membrane protein